MMIVAACYLFVVLVMSLACIGVYYLDKRRAVTGGRRVSERTLHMMGFLGGWPGALFARDRFRHKTKKVSFRITFWIVVLLHLTLVGAVAYVLVVSDGKG